MGTARDAGRRHPDTSPPEMQVPVYKPFLAPICPSRRRRGSPTHPLWYAPGPTSPRKKIDDVRRPNRFRGPTVSDDVSGRAPRRGGSSRPGGAVEAGAAVRSAVDEQRPKLRRTGRRKATGERAVRRRTARTGGAEGESGALERLCGGRPAGAKRAGGVPGRCRPRTGWPARP